MSMNLTLSGTRQIIVVKTGEQEEQSIEYDLWQTPTTVTNACLDAAEGTAQAYFSWALSQDPKYSKGHIKDVKAFIASATAEGYELEWRAI